VVPEFLFLEKLYPDKDDKRFERRNHEVLRPEPHKRKGEDGKREHVEDPPRDEKGLPEFEEKGREEESEKKNRVEQTDLAPYGEDAEAADEIGNPLYDAFDAQ
jgi:hypothetical protein